MFNIALNTFKEIVRNRFLYLILVFAFLFIGLSIFLSQLTIGEGTKVVVDFGIAMIEVFGLVGVLFVGSQLLFKEIEGKTIFLILSKPIQRYEFILGKFLGFGAVILLISLLQSILFLVVISLHGIEINTMIVMSLVFITAKLLILVAMVLFFSTFMSPILTIVVTIMVYMVAHSYSLLISLFETLNQHFLVIFVQILQLVFPPFEALNLKDSIGAFNDYSFVYYLSNIGYSVIYLALILLFTCLIFNKKRFEN